jgi:putative flippase GtrA
MKFIKKLLSMQFIRFAIIGVVNTLVGMGISLLALNLLNLSQWPATALGYLLGSVCSFFLNRHFTFNYKKRDAMQIVRFTVNIIVCYFISNSVAKPLVIYLLSGRPVSEKLAENIVTITANVIFVLLNFFGQKFFAFNKKAAAGSAPDGGEDENDVRDDQD